MPRSMWPWMLSDSGLLLSKSLKRSEAIAAIRKQPRVIKFSVPKLLRQQGEWVLLPNVRMEFESEI